MNLTKNDLSEFNYIEQSVLTKRKFKYMISYYDNTEKTQDVGNNGNFTAIGL